MNRNCTVLVVGDMSAAGKPMGSDDDGDAGPEAGSSQQRIESTEPSVGHIAGAVVAVLLIIAIVFVIVSWPPPYQSWSTRFIK